MEIQTSEGWTDVLNALEKERGLALLLGATDTGKSTLAKYLIPELCRRGVRTALVDADIGQSLLGPPTTIGLSVFESPPDWEGNFPSEIFFVGSTTPEGHFPLHLKGIKRMVDRALFWGAEIILVDTTGFTQGDTGKELKARKVDLLCPRFLVAIQRAEEIDHILTLYGENPELMIFRLKPSDHVKSRSREERRAYRAKKFQEYFKNSKPHKLTLGTVQLSGEVIDANGFSIPEDWALSIKGLLLGLLDSYEDTVALGLIEDYEEGDSAIQISTPAKNIQQVKTLRFSSLRLNASYEDDRIGS